MPDRVLESGQARVLEDLSVRRSETAGDVVVGMWDGAEFVTWQYGAAEVVDWVLT